MEGAPGSDGSMAAVGGKLVPRGSQTGAFSAGTGRGSAVTRANAVWAAKATSRPPTPARWGNGREEQKETLLNNRKKGNVPTSRVLVTSHLLQRALLRRWDAYPRCQRLPGWQRMHARVHDNQNDSWELTCIGAALMDDEPVLEGAVWRMAREMDPNSASDSYSTFAWGGTSSLSVLSPRWPKAVGEF